MAIRVNDGSVISKMSLLKLEMELECIITVAGGVNGGPVFPRASMMKLEGIKTVAIGVNDGPVISKTSLLELEM